MRAGPCAIRLSAGGGVGDVVWIAARSGRPGVGDTWSDEARAGVNAPQLRGKAEQHDERQDRENDEVHLGHLQRFGTVH